MTDEHDKMSLSFSRHKVGRLRRELKKHNANCWKRKKIMLQLQDMIYNDRRNFRVTQ